MSGKGVIPEDHPLAVGWGYGAQGPAPPSKCSRYRRVLAIGVRFSEVSTVLRPASAPALDPRGHQPETLAELCGPKSASTKTRLFPRPPAPVPELGRPCNQRLLDFIRNRKQIDYRKNARFCRCGCDPMAFILALRRCTDRRRWFSSTPRCRSSGRRGVHRNRPADLVHPHGQSGDGCRSAPPWAPSGPSLPQAVTITGDGCS